VSEHLKSDVEKSREMVKSNQSGRTCSPSDHSLDPDQAIQNTQYKTWELSNWLSHRGAPAWGTRIEFHHFSRLRLSPTHSRTVYASQYR